MNRHASALTVKFLVSLALLTATPSNAVADTKSVAVVVDLPANAYASTARYGRAWECLRGYSQVEQACIAMAIPANAYLNAYGDRWECERTFKRADNCSSTNSSTSLHSVP